MMTTGSTLELRARIDCELRLPKVGAALVTEFFLGRLEYRPEQGRYK
jgi:hypothetical protein